jgi:tetratricopeptide (TPR) repeat protein
LSADYSFNAVTLFGWTATDGQDPHAWLALGVLLGLGATAALAWRRHRGLSFFLGLAAVSFLPTSNLLITIGTIMAERLVYLPLVGLVAAAVLMAGTLLEAWPGSSARRAVAWVVTVGVITALTARTIARNEDWTSAARLWESSAEAAPDSIKVIRAQASLAMDADPTGARAGEALAILERGLLIADRVPLPLYHQPAALYDDACRYHLAIAQRLGAGGQADAARAAATRAVAFGKRAEAIDQEINRQGREALRRRGAPPEQIRDRITLSIYRNLGSAYLAAGEPAQALATLAYLQRTQPDRDESHYGVAVAHGALAEWEESRGNRPGADAHLRAAAVNLIVTVVLNPEHQDAWQALQHVYGVLSPASPGVHAPDGRPALDRTNPLVAAQVGEACAQLVRQLTEAGMPREADRWRCR